MVQIRDSKILVRVLERSKTDSSFFKRFFKSFEAHLPKFTEAFLTTTPFMYGKLTKQLVADYRNFTKDVNIKDFKPKGSHFFISEDLTKVFIDVVEPISNKELMFFYYNGKSYFYLDGFLDPVTGVKIDSNKIINDPDFDIIITNIPNYRTLVYLKENLEAFGTMIPPKQGIRVITSIKPIKNPLSNYSILYTL